MTKNIEINLSEADWEFVQSEIERLKREENADVTLSEVVGTLVEVGIQREEELRKPTTPK